MTKPTPRKSLQWRGFLILFILLILSVPHCDIDHGLVPIQSRIGGNILFMGEPPSRTDEVRVAVVKDFPPRAINELLFSDQIPYDQDTARWEIYLPPRRYAAVLVVWKEKNRSWNLSDIIGLYGGTFAGDMLLPTYKPVTVPDESAVMDTLDIEANLNRVNRDAAIEGTVTFNGEWPPNTGVVGIGAFFDIPLPGNIIDYFLKNVALEYNVPLNVPSYDYLLRVQSNVDTLKYVAALWIDDDYDLTSIRDIGFYRNPIDPDNPGNVLVYADSTTTGIDITVNFNEF